MIPEQLGFYLLVSMMSMAISMAIIPIMMRLAPYIGMLDSPDKRKVHNVAIPRSGGVGIVIGLLTPLLIWLDYSRFSLSFISGCLILLLFGAWDDARNIRPAIKFLGQLLAAGIVVYYGDIYVSHLPFTGLNELDEIIAKPFTVFAIIGMINALNLSDGLDGLAGGEALISLSALAYLMYQFESVAGMMIIAATIGGIFGFLRFNSHPARIFMGDSGSQTLGFILAVLVVYLTQNINELVSPVIALLLLGLPVIDSLVVFYKRARRGDSLVIAARDHMHHRLLKLGFYHYETVIIIYSLQMIMVVIAILIPYESDLLLTALYTGICLAIFLTLTLAEWAGWIIHRNKLHTSIFRDIVNNYDYLKKISFRLLKNGISLFLISAAVMSVDVPTDLGVFAIVIAAGLAGEYLYRLSMFITIGFSVYLISMYPPEWLLEKTILVYLFFSVITFLSFLSVRILAKEQFQITPLDYLVVLMVVGVSTVPGIEHGTSSIMWMVVQIIILFYACEIVIQNMTTRVNGLTGAATLALTLIAFRGLL